MPNFLYIMEVKSISPKDTSWVPVTPLQAFREQWLAEDFADMAGIHRTYVSSIELGKVDVGIGVVYKIAGALNLPLSKLLKETETHLED